jgi:glutathione peroxidase
MGCVLCKIGIGAGLALVGAAGVSRMVGGGCITGACDANTTSSGNVQLVADASTGRGVELVDGRIEDDKPADVQPSDSKTDGTAGDGKAGEGEPGDKPTEGAVAKPADPYVLTYTMKDIAGKDQDLSQYKGSVVLIVNVASKCGYTPQYKGLEALYRAKKEAGLVVLGFPANNFGAQEPGTEEEIAQFCKSKYDVTFPMFAKVSVKGEDIVPLYAQLTSQPAPIGGAISWNFNKFLVDRAGKVVARFDSRTQPDDAAMLNRIEELLKAK